MEIENFFQDISSHQSHYKNNFLNKINNQAVDDLKDSSFPTKKNDDWKYSNLSKALGGQYLISNNQKKEASVLYNETSDFHHITLHHPVNDKDLESIGAKLGINLRSIAAIESEKALEIINEDNYFKDEFLAILNNTSFSNGIILSLDNNIELKKAILLDHLFEGKNTHHCYQTFFSLKNHSKMSIIEKISSNGDNNFINYKSHVLLDDSSFLSHTILQDSAIEDIATIQLNTHCHTNSHYNNCIIHTGAKFSRSNLFINLRGENATADVNGLYLLADGQHHDTMSFIKHAAPHSYSNQLYKGILKDNSRGIFTGKVRVEKHAQQIVANQLNKNLLLTNKAHANSRPQMEIYADDVKCAHGSTTGQISEDELFYFESRGIKPQIARSMLAQGYSNDVILKIMNPAIQKLVLNILKEKGDIDVAK